jgi:uncharacterized protein (DUF2384 family)
VESLDDVPLRIIKFNKNWAVINKSGRIVTIFGSKKEASTWLYRKEIQQKYPTGRDTMKGI